MNRAEAIAALRETLDELTRLDEQKRLLYGRLIQTAQHIVGAEFLEVGAAQEISTEDRALQRMRAWFKEMS